MGQQSSKQAATTLADIPEDAATVSPVSPRSSTSRFGAWSRKLRSTTFRRNGKASFFGNLFKNRDPHQNHQSIANVVDIPVTVARDPAAPLSPPLVAPPVLPEPNMTSPESLTIMEGAISTMNGAYRRSISQDHPSTPDTTNHTASGSGSSGPHTSENGHEDSSATPAMDERLQSSIDILAALLSMATAATATSLLTGTTDVLSTLASDSPSGPQVSPTRARAAWDILQNLFYLRLNRASTLSPHIELFRDLALAVLTARTITTPVSPRNDRPPLPSGTFERFLVDLNASVRASLRDDYTRRGASLASEGVEGPRRLNWWRAYQFPSLVTDSSLPGPLAGRNAQSSAPNSQPPESRNEETSTETADGQTRTPSQPSGSNLVPVVLVGLRSLSRDTERGIPGFGVPPSRQSSAESTNSVGGESSSSPSSPSSDRPSLADNVDAITSSYVIIVLGGHYPPEHRYASTIGSEDANELDQLWDLVDLVPTGPKTATAEEISKAGLTCFKASRISEMQVAENTVERCLICLEEYDKDSDLRLLKCTHAFHKDCVDRWLTEGQNGCPLCRAQGVQR